MAAGSAAPAVAVRVWPLKGASEVAAALGRAPALRLLRHPHVAPLLDCLRGRHFGIVTVAESGAPLRARLARLAASGDEAWLARVLRDVLLGLAFLHARRLAHRALCLDAVEFDGDGRARLADAWVGELCNGGHGAAFALGHPAYAPPEALLLPARPSPAHAHTHAPAADVWAVGVLASELLSVASLTPATPAAALRALAAAPEAATVRAGASEALQDLVRACLAPLASDRPSVFQLLHHPLFAPLPRPLAPSRWQQRPALRCLSLLEPAAPPTPDAGRRAAADAASSELADAYALWRAAGADPERELLAAQPPSPPVLRLPSLVLLAAAPAHRPAALRDDPRPFLLSLADLRRRPSLPPPTSSAASASATTPTVPRSLSSSSASTPSLTSSASSAPLTTTPAPVSPRTLGSATAARVKQLRELLAALPASLPRLALELRAADVPAALRPELWAALLGVSTAEAATAYAAVDKEAEGAADRQIEVDIPRCHQYNELLASPEGQRKLKRVLKAWVARHAGQLVYWQGLDSLLAPLLTVFYPSEALAYAGLVRVVAKYCREFFRPDNSGPMQEHLLRFRQLLAYHDPALATHLQSVGFSPDLYAIPWFLTLFSHLLPLDKLYLLWDSLLAGSPALPFFVALAVLREMRTTLLPLDFNACILFFSHLPELDVRELLRQAALYEERTPPSAVVPFAPPPALPGAAAPLPLDERLNEWAPRIAPTEALRLRHALLVDLRRAKEFEAEHVVGAVPINHRNPSIAQFDAYRGRPMLLVADARGRQAAELARQLVEAGHAEVALVHGGHDALRAVAGVRLEGAGVGSGV